MKTKADVERAAALLRELEDISTGMGHYEKFVKDYRTAGVTFRTTMDICLIGPGRCTSFARIPMCESTMKTLVRNYQEAIVADLAVLGVRS